ncbi:hypothetical protein [Methylobacterium sp. A54F]
MTLSTLRICLAAASLLVPAAWTGTASADCLRRVYNRSPYVLVGNQDGGPPFTVLPGRAATLRLSRPGRIDLAAYCALGSGPGAAQVTRAQFDYEADIDRCYVNFGSDFFFPRQIGRGFFGSQGTSPFTVNNPEQGDIVLGPFASECPVLSRGG